MYYVLVRNQTPQGNISDIESILGSESPDVKAVFEKNHVKVRSLIPSRDASRFAGIEEVPIPPDVVQRMCDGLREVGYRLSEPYESRERASEFWETGR